VSDKSITRLAKALNIEIFQLFMPHYLGLEELDTKDAGVLLEFWQKTKLKIEKLDAEIDSEFKTLAAVTAPS
jgi:hypothetical protein